MLKVGLYILGVFEIKSDSLKSFTSLDVWLLLFSAIFWLKMEAVKFSKAF